MKESVQIIVVPLSNHLNGHDLLSDNGEHFDVDAVEFVEAGPGSAGCQTFEKLPHGDVVQACR